MCRTPPQIDVRASVCVCVCLCLSDVTLRSTSNDTPIDIKSCDDVGRYHVWDDVMFELMSSWDDVMFGMMSCWDDHDVMFGMMSSWDDVMLG